MSDVQLDIQYINNLLAEGKTVKEVRSILDLGEKSFQKQIKKQGYKYNQKIKQYEPITELIEAQQTNISDTTTKSTTEVTTISPTLSTTEQTTVKYLDDNIELLKQLLENYKRSVASEGRNDIIINLINDKHLKPKPKTIRINEFVWQDWLEFTKDLQNYNKGDLVSQALIEFMQKYKK